MRILLRTVGYFEHAVMSLAFAPGSDRIASGVGYQKLEGERHRTRLVLLDPCSGEELALLYEGRNYLRTLAYSPDGRLLAAGVGDRTVRLWDSSTLQEIAAWRGHTRNAVSLAFSPDGRLLATGSADYSHMEKKGEVKLWDVGTGRELAHRYDPNGVWSVAFSPDGQTVALGSDRIVLWSVQPGEVTSEMPLKAIAKALTFVPGSPLLVSAAGVEIAFWSTDSMKLLARCKVHRQVITSIALFPRRPDLGVGQPRRDGPILGY